MATFNINIINPTIDLISEVTEQSNDCTSIFEFKVKTIPNSTISMASVSNKDGYEDYLIQWQDSAGTWRKLYEASNLTIGSGEIKVRLIMENYASNVMGGFDTCNTVTIYMNDLTNTKYENREFTRCGGAIPCNQVDEPIANDDEYEVIKGGVKNLLILDNDDSGSSYTTLDINIKSQPSHGTIEILDSGEVKYTHVGDTLISDSFTYSVTNGADKESNIATVTITLTEPDTEIKWIAAGFFNSSSHNIITSTDGVNWNYSRIPTMYNVYELKYLDGRWFAVGGVEEGIYTWDNRINNKVMVSDDAITWTDVNVPYLDRVMDIHYNGTLWVATGRNETYTETSSTIVTSPDLINWTSRGADTFDVNFMGVSFANNIWVGYGETDSPTGGCLAYSTDGENWNNVFYTDMSFGYDAYYNGDYWLATGYKGYEVSTVAKSVDGMNWTPVTNPPVDDTGRRIGYFKNKWLVGGKGSYEIASSTDGENWIGRLNENIVDIRDFVHDNNKVIAVGVENNNSGKIYSSSDGINWQEISSVDLGLFAIVNKITQ